MTVTRGKRSVIVGIRVDEDVHEALVAAAARERRPVSSFCRNVLVEYLSFVARQSRRAAREQREPQRADGEMGVDSCST
jgi:hypothetical protein